MANLMMLKHKNVKYVMIPAHSVKDPLKMIVELVLVDSSLKDLNV